MDFPEIKTEQDFFMHFFPMHYFREQFIPATVYALKEIPDWSLLKLKEIVQGFWYFQFNAGCAAPKSPLILRNTRWWYFPGYKLCWHKGSVRINSSLQHYTFRKALSNRCVQFNKDITPVMRRLSMEDVHVNNSHVPSWCYLLPAVVTFSTWIYDYTNYILSSTSTTFQCNCARSQKTNIRMILLVCTHWERFTKTNLSKKSTKVHSELFCHNKWFEIYLRLELCMTYSYRWVKHANSINTFK